MEAYISIGILFLLGEIFLELKNKYSNKIGKYLILFLFFFVTGLSYKIHNDYEVYEFIYNIINIENISSMEKLIGLNIESGFLHLNLLFKNTLNFDCFKALVYLFNTFLIYKGIRSFFDEKKSLFIVTLLYFYGVFYFFYLPSFRQSIGISIFIYSLQYIKNKNFIKYVGLISIACLFHKSCVVLFLVYFFINFFNFNKKILSIFLIIDFLNYYFLEEFWVKTFGAIISFIGKFYPSILWNKYFDIVSKGSPREFIFYVFIFGIAILLYSEKEKFYMNGFVIFQIFYFFEKHIPIAYRFALFFRIFFIFYLVILLEKINNQKLKLALKYLTLLFFLLNFNLRFIAKKSQEGCYIPFHSSLELLYKDIPYEDTAEFIHVQNRNKDPKDFVKRKIK